MLESLYLMELRHFLRMEEIREYINYIKDIYGECLGGQRFADKT